MASVVFLRGVNVGGHKAFRPSQLVAALAPLDVVSIGAAGTFVVRDALSEARVRAAFRKALPFDTDMMICPDRAIVALVEAKPFDDAASRKADVQYICVLGKQPPKLPPLPIRAPEGNDWQVSITEIRGAFATALYRRVGKTLVYPNQVVEKRIGVPSTTRGWPTILKIYSVLNATIGSTRVARRAGT